MKPTQLKTLLTSSLLSLALLPAANAQDSSDTQTAASIESAQPASSTQAKTAKSVGRLKSTKESKGLEHKGANLQGQKISGKNNKIDKSHHDVWIHSVDIDLLEDPNHNGYYNRIIVDFDADTHYSSIEVYAELALTDSYGVTTTYFTTDDFYLWGESYSDDYEVDTVLTTNWPADGYDLSISLYDAYSHNLVAYIDDSDTSALYDLHLESLDYEYQAPHHLTVFSNQSWLVDDVDGDGYYRSFSIDLDIDNNYGSSDVYAQVFISADSVNWESLYVSEHFVINENDTSDKFSMEFDLATGYAPDHYHLRVEIIDANNHMTMLTIEPQSHSALYALPLEDSVNDTISQPATPPPAEPVRTSVSTESGGSFGLYTLALMVGLLFTRRRLV